MALENWLVIFEQEAAGAGFQIPFKNQTEAASSGTPTIEATIAVVEAGTAQEACTAVRRAYGDGVVTGKMKVVKSSSIEEKTA